MSCGAVESSRSTDLEQKNRPPLAKAVRLRPQHYSLRTQPGLSRYRLLAESAMIPWCSFDSPSVSLHKDELTEHLPLCLWARPSSPPVVYFLADHLDAVLASGEDLTQISMTWISTAAKSQDATIRDRDNMRDDVDAVRSLELQLIARLLKARDRADELMRTDPRLKLMSRLFLSGTAQILEAIPELSDATAADFETGDAMLAYFRSRGLISAHAAAPGDGAVLRVTDTFLVGRRIALGAILDLVAQFLDTVELHHDIYADAAVRMLPPKIEEVDTPMPEKAKRSKPTVPEAVPANSSNASGTAPASDSPRRPAYKSLTAALDALEKQLESERTEREMAS